MEAIINSYYANNARKLHKMVDKILKKLGFSSLVDSEDFYSLANEIFVDVLKRYDNKQDFNGFLYSCLIKKFKTEMTRRNRIKRKADRESISIDTPVGEEDGITTLADMIASNINIEKEILGDSTEILMNERIEKYLESLSRIQRKIIEMKMQNVEIHSIKEELGITDSQYSSYMQDAIRYEHIRLLHI